MNLIHQIRYWPLAITILLLLAVAADGQKKSRKMTAPKEAEGDPWEGRKAYRRAFWTTTGLTCIHCHADFNEKKDPFDKRIRPGHSLYNSANRAIWRNYKGEMIKDLKTAMKVCIDTWIVKPDSAEIKAKAKAAKKRRRRRRKVTEKMTGWDHMKIMTDITAYLKEMSPERSSKPVEVTREETIPSDRTLKSGNPATGRVIFERSCSICHADGPAPSLYRNGYTHRQIARKVRGLSPEGIAGVIMPGFSIDRLSKLELINVVSHVAKL